MSLVDYLIRRSERTPYFDLYDEHRGGALYMERNWLMPRWLLYWDTHEHCFKAKKWMPFSIRLHTIARPDLDRDLHDHPASFISFILRGGYTELRPTSQVPCWRYHHEEDWAEEDTYEVTRKAGSVAFRSYQDRHRISTVEPGTVTLVIWFRKRQSWGFFSPMGKIHWQSYVSVHNDQPTTPS